MKTVAARAVMALASHCFGDHRRDWARAMEVEFEAAAGDGKPLAFAIGCLTAAWREMPTHAEGRFALANHALAVGLIVPMAALLITGVLLGFPYLSPDDVGVHGLLARGGAEEPSFNEGNRAAVPSLAALVFLLGVGHLLIAWAMLDRDWTRVTIMGKLSAALAATLVGFMAVLFLDDTRALLQAAALAVELTAVSTLARWHHRLLGADGR